jgi:hypothetical protein
MAGLRATLNTTASDTIDYGLLGPRVENPLMVNSKFGHFLITIKGFCPLVAINRVYTQSERIERRGHPRLHKFGHCVTQDGHQGQRGP